MKIKDNISRPRLEVTEKLEDAVCAHQEWSEAIEAMKKLKFEKMQVLNRLSKAINVSHEKLKESLVDTGVHDARSPSFWHTTKASPSTRSQRTIWDLCVHLCSFDLSRFSCLLVLLVEIASAAVHLRTSL